MLSESVAKAMELTGGPVVSETVKFITMMDKFFDCLNVDNYSSGFTQRKPFKQPYRSANDFRLTWLEKEFLPYLDQWEQSVLCRDVEGDKGNMLLSNETLLGIRLTGQLLCLMLFECMGLLLNTFFLISDILHWLGDIHLHPSWCNIISQRED